MPPTYIKLYWDGVYNVRTDGALVAKGGPDGLPDLALNNFLLPLIPSVPGPSLIERATRQIRAVIAPSKPGEISADRNTMQAPTVAVHIGMKDANGWRGVAANYHPNGALQKIPEYDLKM